MTLQSRLNNILKRCEAATPFISGPHRSFYAKEHFNQEDDGPVEVSYSEMICCFAPHTPDANRFFVYHARLDLPLVVQSLQKAVGAIKILQRYHWGDGSISRETVIATLGTTFTEIEKLLGGDPELREK